jgi:hypothetical protein
LAAEHPPASGCRAAPSFADRTNAEVQMLQARENREQLAREFVRKAKKNAATLFAKESSQRFFRVRMEGEYIEKLVELAREGDKEALEILQKCARSAARSGVDVPKCLHEFVWEVFIDGPPKAKPGSSPKDTELKYQTIALLVKIVSQDYGFPEYGNPEGRDDPDAPMSACRLVAEELGLSDSMVEKIWGERKEMVLRERPPQ